MSFFKNLFRRTLSHHVAPAPATYADTVQHTASMVRNPGAQALALRHGLNVLDLTWEDAGRYKGSCVGPNISDMTIQVQHEGEVTCMPVIRFPNFSDHTCDIDIDDIEFLVGNEKNADLERVTLKEYLGDLKQFLSDPDSWPGTEESLLSPDESEVLVSAQACFLPVPKEGEAHFNPVLFNYQSRAGAPAVLAILATREGTSATIIDNNRDAFGSGRAWGQRLFHNANGERASLTGTRIEDFVAAGGDGLDAPTSVEEAKAAGLNQVLLIQVPLVQPEENFGYPMAFEACAPTGVPCYSRSAGGSLLGAFFAESDVEEAVIGHGPVEGPFTEIDGVKIVRDTRFPIRVTVQFYKATSNGAVSAADVAEIKANIDAVYADAKASGSLVIGGETGRKTEWDDEGLGKAEPKDWWTWVNEKNAKA